MAKRRKITKEAIEKLRREMQAANPKPKLPRYLFDNGMVYKLTPALRGSWYFQYRMAGRKSPSWIQIDRFGVLAIPEVERRITQLKAEIADGGDPAKERAKGKLRTIGALIDGFEAARKGKGRRSADAMAKTLRRHLSQHLSRPAVTFTKDDVAAVLSSLMDSGYAQSANKMRRLMHAMFRWGAGQSWVRVNPVATVEAPAPEISRDRILSDSELVEVWNASAKLLPAWTAAVRLLILTAQRRNEVGGMLADELHMPSSLWTIQAARAKNGNADLTQLTQRALAVLSVVPKFEKCSYVLSNDGVSPVGGWSKLKTALDKAILDARKAAAGAAGEDPEQVQPMPHWTLHDLRRTAATGMARLGVQPHVLDRVLHHSPKRQGILATYNMFEYFPERLDALTKWSAKVDELVAMSELAQQAA
jgi:integrase